MKGVYTALVTPFDSSGAIDWPAYRRILEDQADAKISGVIVCGTTGETPALTSDEKKSLVKTAVDTLKGRGVKILAGTGTNNTAETIEFSKWASDLGVDGLLVVTPYYSKPSQAGLQAHFLAVADAVRSDQCELMLYNVPGRTGVSLTPATIARLSSHPKIKSLKEATGSVSFTSEVIDHLQANQLSIDILSGDDATYLPLLSVGAVGVVSVVSNLFPRAMIAIQHAMENNQPKVAMKLHQKYFPLFRDLFIESNPVPIKFALNLAGFCSPNVRSPLAPLTAQSVDTLKASLERVGVRSGSRL